MKTSDSIKQTYGKRIRLRVCGILRKADSILLLEHTGLGPKGKLWIPPGGGVEYGQPVKENLKREFAEETGLSVKIGAYMFTYEYFNKPLHTVELFFRVHEIGGALKLGYDPELKEKDQIIKSFGFYNYSEIKKMRENRMLHNAFDFINDPIEIFNLKGFLNYEIFA